MTRSAIESMACILQAGKQWVPFRRPTVFACGFAFDDSGRKKNRRRSRERFPCMSAGFGGNVWAADPWKDVTILKRLTVLALCLCLLCVPVRAAQEEKLVALTFDDGPSGRFTRKLLEGLEERSAKATFLLCGYRMEQYPELTERICCEGHEIGLHGYSHQSMEHMTRNAVLQELEATMALLPEGCPVSFLRSPGGLCGEWVQSAAAELGLAVLHWSVDPKDWATNDIRAIEDAVISRVQDGDVILLHDMSDSSVEAALGIIDALQERGFRFVTVSELAAARSITLVPGQRYARFARPGA